MNLNQNTKKNVKPFIESWIKKNRLQSDEIELKLDEKKEKKTERKLKCMRHMFFCPKPKNKHFLLLYQARGPFPSKISIGKISVYKKIIELECVYILICIIYIYCSAVYDDYVRRQQENREQDEEVNVYSIIILLLVFSVFAWTYESFFFSKKKNTLKVFHIIYSQHTDIFLHAIQPRNVLYEEVWCVKTTKNYIYLTISGNGVIK